MIFNICKFIKFLSVSTTYNKHQSLENLLIINIIEGVFYDYYITGYKRNAYLGLSLIPLLKMLKKKQIIDNEGLKLWFIIYFFWNISIDTENKSLFHNNNLLLSNNFPPLWTSLLSFNFSHNELLNNFCLMRSASLRTSLMM